MNPQEMVELLRRTGCVIAVVSVSVAKAQEIQTLAPVVVTGRSANLAGVADSATEGTISARQLATRPLLRLAEVPGSVPWLTGTPWFRTKVGLRLDPLCATVSPLDGPFNARRANDIEYWGSFSTRAERPAGNGGNGFDGRLVHPLEPRTLRVSVRASV